MRILKKKHVIVLSHRETKTWESGTPDAFALREFVHRFIRLSGMALDRHVEIYASKRDGGWTADVIEPPQQTHL